MNFFSKVAEPDTTCRLRWSNRFTAMEKVLCSRHNPSFLQLNGSGSHLYPAHLHTVRSDRGAEVLPTLVGLSLWDCLALPFCTLIVSQLGRFVKRFLKFLSKDFFYSVRPSPLASCGLLLTSLTLYHISGGLSRGFSEISEIFSGVGRVHFCGSFPIPTRRSRPTPWTGLLPRPLTLQIIAHLPIECNRQNAQNRDFYFPKLCATFCLTNCWRCVIMEILRASPVGAPPKKPPQKWGGFRISWADLRP